MKKSLTLILSGFLSALALSSVPAFAKKGVAPQSVHDMSTGLPDVAKSPLNESSFVSVEARKLAHPQLVMVNLDALREMGVDVPEQGLTPEFAQQLLDEWAWAIPTKGDDPSKFTSETKTFYADKYGGSGIGDNGGSARAMAAGEFQLKAAGITPLIEKETAKPEVSSLKERIQEYLVNFKHSSGKMGLPEAMMEYTWGDVLNRELPYGANRAVAIISSGLSTHTLPGVSEPAAIVVRQNSIRPAHFIRNWAELEKNDGSEQSRISQLDQQIEAALPKPEGAQPKVAAQRIASELNEFIDRVGKLFGAEYALGIYHGSTSPSNIDLRGKAVDHAPNTAVYGFPKLMFRDDYPSGSIKNFLDYILYEFVDDLDETLPKNQAAKLPSHSEVERKLSASFRNQVKKTFLWIAGTPDEWVDDMAATDAGNRLAVLLTKIAEAGNDDKVDSISGVPTEDLGKYDFNDIVRALARSEVRSDDETLSQLVQDSELRLELQKKFQAYFAALSARASQEGIADDSLRAYVADAAQIRAKSMPDLMRTRSNLTRMYLMTAKYKLTKNPTGIAEFIQSTIQGTARHEKNLPPYRLVLEERHDFQTGGTIRRVLDLKTGMTEILVQSPISGSNADFFGKQVPVDLLNDAHIEVDSGSNQLQGRLMSTPADGDDYATFEIPDPARSVALDQFHISLDAPNGVFSSLKIAADSKDIRLVPPELDPKPCDAQLLNSP